MGQNDKQQNLGCAYLSKIVCELKEHHHRLLNFYTDFDGGKLTLRQ